MTSIGRVTAQVSRATGYYIPLQYPLTNTTNGSRKYIYAEPTVSANNTMTAFSTAAWATDTLGGRYLSSLSSAAAGPGLLKDMGKTLVSSGRVFRKIQLVAPTAASGSTFGVAGDSGTTSQDYLTGYIELGFGELGGNGVPAPVASFGR